MVCVGLSLTLSASIGTSWTWSLAAPNSQSLVLSPVNNGVVNVTVTLANGCTVSSQPYGYTVNSVPTVTNSYIDTTACEGLTNHIVVKVVPPAGNTFIWQPGNMTGPSPSIIVSSTLTAYSVTITNGFGCKTSTLVTYTVYPLPVITATSAANPVCSGAQTTLTASGGVMYGWLPGNPTPIIAQSITVAPTTATTYTVVGFDGYCPNTATITQSVSVLTPTFVANRDKMCITRESVLLTVYGGTAHAWLNPGITATTPSIVVSPTITTSYSVIITGANSCTALAVKSITVNACTGIEANNQAQAFRIYPNPSNGEFFISSATDINIRIMNNAGQLIRQFHLSNDNDYKVSVADLVPGIYFVVSESEGRNSTQKIVITK